MRPGEVVAYNQAGFIPFMLDVDNIDDLGICSRFYAELPTTDLYFTEVGRYSPLTNSRQLRAGEAYLAVRERAVRPVAHGHPAASQPRPHPRRAVRRLLSARTARSRSAERDLPPHREARRRVSHRSRGLYGERRPRVVPSARLDRRRRRTESDYQTRLIFLQDLTSELAYTGTLTIDVEFATRDELVREVTLERVRASEPATLRIRLATSDDRTVHEATFALERDQPIEIESAAPAGARASRLTLQLTSAAPARVWLTDVGVRGQTPAFERYIGRRLRFPAPTSATPQK